MTFVAIAVAGGTLISGAVSAGMAGAEAKKAKKRANRAQSRVEDIGRNRQAVINPYENVENLSDMASNLSAIYQHYSTLVNRANFYTVQNDSTITTIFNQNPSLVKTFQTINYEGASNWALTSFVTNEDEANAIAVYSVPLTLADMESQLLQNKFKAKEDKYFANLINTSAVTQGEVIYGAAISGVKGFFATAKLTATNTATSGTNELFATSTNYIESSY